MPQLRIIRIILTENGIPIKTQFMVMPTTCGTNGMEQKAGSNPFYHG